ncbi:MAG: hypothetical protein CALGDGBN_02660 [Pseudomonadales bacterium]|nr:hypothetical protein [Pseudomonadales bacterium]
MPDSKWAFLAAHPVFYLLVMLVLTGCCYLGGIGDFYLFDSQVWLARNQSLTLQTLTFPAIYEASLSAMKTGPFGRPVSMLSFAVESWLAGGMFPSISKFINITIHLMNGGLLFLIVKRCAEVYVARRPESKGAPAATFAIITTGLWLLHPLHVSTVLYAVQRMAMLSATFMLAGIFVYVSARARQIVAQNNYVEWLSTLPSVFALTVLAAMAKETGLLLPLFVALIELFIFQANSSSTRDKLLIRLSQSVLLAVPAVLVTIYVSAPEFIVRGYQIREFDMTERVLTQFRLLWNYLSWIYIPNIRALTLYHDDFPLSTSLWSPISTLLAAIAWAGLIAFSLRIRKAAPLVVLAVLWFLYAHSLESTVFALELSFEHRNYFASIGPLALLSAGLMRAGVAFGRFSLIPSVAVIAVLAFLLSIRAHFWSDELRLASYHYAMHPDSPRAAYHFANVNLRRGESREDPNEVRESILQARQGYEALQASDSYDLLAAATLFYIDERWFPSLAAAEQWEKKIERAVQGNKVWAPTDYNAVGLLMDCVNKRICRLSSDALVQSVVDLIGSNCCDNAMLNRYVALYFLGAGNDPRRALQYAELAIRENPKYFPAYLVAIEACVNLGLHGRAAELVGDWAVQDRLKSRIATITGLIE